MSGVAIGSGVAVCRCCPSFYTDAERPLSMGISPAPLAALAQRPPPRSRLPSISRGSPVSRAEEAGAAGLPVAAHPLFGLADSLPPGGIVFGQLSAVSAGLDPHAQVAELALGLLAGQAAFLVGHHSGSFFGRPVTLAPRSCA